MRPSTVTDLLPRARSVPSGRRCVHVGERVLNVGQISSVSASCVLLRREESDGAAFFRVDGLFVWAFGAVPFKITALLDVSGNVVARRNWRDILVKSCARRSGCVFQRTNAMCSDVGNIGLQGCG